MKVKDIYKTEISRLKEVIVSEYRPQKIVLFGSCAEGNLRRYSDIDMLIIKRTDDDYWKRNLKLWRCIDPNLPFEPIVLTPREVEKRIKLGDLFIKYILQKGKVLYEAA